MYWRSTRNIGKLFSSVRIRCIDAQLDAQLEILESYLAALELDVLVLAQLETTGSIGKLFSCLRIRCIDAQLEILGSSLVAL